MTLFLEVLGWAVLLGILFLPGGGEPWLSEHPWRDDWRQP